LEEIGLGIDVGPAGTEVDGFEAIGAGEAGVDAAERDGHIGEGSVFDHGRDGLEILIGWGANAPAAWAVIFAGDDEVMAFAAWCFDGREADATDGEFVGDGGEEGTGLHFIEALADDFGGFEDFVGADEDPCPDVAVGSGDDVEVESIVGGVGMIATAIDIDTGGAGDGAEERGIFDEIRGGDADAAHALLEIAIVGDGTGDGEPFGVELVDGMDELIFKLRGDVPADAADEAEGVGFAVAANFFGDPHDGFADAEGVHEEGVEADDVTGEADPEEVAVETFEFEHDGADVFGAWGCAECGGLFDGLGVGDVMDAAADTADAFGGHGDIVVGEDGLGEFFDTAMDHEAAVFATADGFAVDVEAEMGGFIEGGVEGAEGDDDATFGWGIEFEIAIGIEAVGEMVPGLIFAEWMGVFGPAVGEDEALWVMVTDGFDADEVAELAFRP
jgi:hypothetical protein